MIAAATTPAPAATGFQRFLEGLADLVRFGRGSSAFEVDEYGNLVHVGTVVTIKMAKGESLEAFHHRMRRDYGLKQGDKIEVLNSDGRCDTIRLTLRPR